MLVHGAPPLPPNPRSVDEALAQPDGSEWRIAIQDEINQLENKETLGDAAQAGRAMKTKWVLKYSYDNDYRIKRKARLVVCGYSQVFGLDYRETYAPTTTTVVVFMLLHLAGVFGLFVSTFDVSGAFLEGRQDIPQYAWLPKELAPAGLDRYRVEILGNWYGTKQAPKIWNDHLDKQLRDMGFTRCPVMPTLYYKWVGSDYICLTVHVDDGLIVATDPALTKEFIRALQDRLTKVKLFEEFDRYLGMDYKRNGIYITMSQEHAHAGLHESQSPRAQRDQ
jgi:hypothetical protein